MIKKLLIRPFIGELPEYMDRYMDNINSLKKYGFDWLIFTDKNKYIELIEKKLGLKVDLGGHLLNPSEFRPAFGLIFEDYLKGYDFWGHTDFDCVYGRLDRFVSDEFLSSLDIFGNDLNAMCGPFSLYRNNDYINNLFKEHPKWQRYFLDHKHHAFDEQGMSEVVRRIKEENKARVEFRHWMADDKQRHKIEIKEDGTLLSDGDEVMMYHFRKTKIYPTIDIK